MADDDLMKAAKNAAMMLDGIYEWLHRVDGSGGATSVSGIATVNAFLKSLRTNKARTIELVIKPLQAAIDKAESAK